MPSPSRVCCRSNPDRRRDPTASSSILRRLRPPDPIRSTPCPPPASASILVDDRSHRSEQQHNPEPCLSGHHPDLLPPPIGSPPHFPLLSRCHRSSVPIAAPPYDHLLPHRSATGPPKDKPRPRQLGSVDPIYLRAAISISQSRQLSPPDRRHTPTDPPRPFPSTDLQPDIYHLPHHRIWLTPLHINPLRHCRFPLPTSIRNNGSSR